MKQSKELTLTSQVLIGAAVLVILVGLAIFFTRGGDQTDGTEVASVVQQDNISGIKTADNIRYEVREWQCPVGGEAFSQIRPPTVGHQYCTLKVEVTNTGDKNDLFDLNDQIIVYDNKHYKVNSQATTAINQNMMPGLTADSRNIPSVINMVFELPKPADNPRLDKGVRITLKSKNSQEGASFDINVERE